MQTVTRESFRFMLEQSGYATPPGRAVCAIRSARAETLLRRAEDAGVAEVVWDDDDYFPGWQSIVSEEEERRLFDSGEWTGPFLARLRIGDDDYAATLGGIVVGPRGTDDPYCRVVAADLADECRSQLLRALGLAPGSLHRTRSMVG